MDARDGAGRGLIAESAVAMNAALFEEQPLIVIRSVWDEIDRHHAPRWRAYKVLAARAAAETDEEGAGEGATPAGSQGKSTYFPQNRDLFPPLY